MANDAAETRAFKLAFGELAYRIPVSSTKSMIGHCLGAAGAIECVAVVLQLYRGFVHPSLNCEDLHPEIIPFAKSVPHAAVGCPDLKIVAKAGFGFGDVNSCLMFKKWEG